MTQHGQKVTQRRVGYAEVVIREAFDRGLRDVPGVRNELIKARKAGDIETIPSDRTIRRILRDVETALADAPAGLDSVSPGDVRLYIGTLAEVIAATEGRVVHLTRAELGYALKIAAAVQDAPGLGSWERYRLARAYVVRERTGQPTTDLDALLALAPWRDNESREVYERLVEAGRVPELPRYLKDSALPVVSDPVEVEAVLRDALGGTSGRTTRRKKRSESKEGE